MALAAIEPLPVRRAVATTLNVTCSPGLWQRYRRVAKTSSALIVRGRLEKSEGVLNLVADRIEATTPPVTPASRDFR